MGVGVVVVVDLVVVGDGDGNGDDQVNNNRHDPANPISISTLAPPHGFR